MLVQLTMAEGSVLCGAGVFFVFFLKENWGTISPVSLSGERDRQADREAVLPARI